MQHNINYYYRVIIRGAVWQISCSRMFAIVTTVFGLWSLYSHGMHLQSIVRLHVSVNKCNILGY